MLHEILVMCMLQIDPRMDKFFCVQNMVKCTKKFDFNDCSEYWEPLSPVDEKLIKDVAKNESN